jgi:hypothetical protein
MNIAVITDAAIAHGFAEGVQCADSALRVGVVSLKGDASRALELLPVCACSE